MQDYITTYGNLDLFQLDEKELHAFATDCVQDVLRSMYLIAYTEGYATNQTIRGVTRVWDLSNYELSELLLISSDLLDGITKNKRSYIERLDNLLFMVSMFDNKNTVNGSVKAKIKEKLQLEMRKQIAKIMKAQIKAGKVV